ncbi:MAG: Peptide transporter permease, partial [Phenylobacterium sp.]|nr:Peptide transporter permease [Phenylobacterium sp.]
MSAGLLVPGSRDGARSMERAALKGRSLWDDARRRLLCNRGAVAGMVVLGLLVL